MAKFDGIFDIQGTLKGMTFYKTADGIRIRTKGGISKQRIMNDPAFARTRENGREFGNIASSGKLLRNALGPLVFQAKDAKMTGRLVKIMGQVKNLDSVSARGDRNVAQGLTELSAKQLLKGFDFNAKAPLGTVLNSAISVTAATGVVDFSAFNPKEQLRAPDGASHFSLQSGFLRLDFETGSSALALSPELEFPLVQSILTPVLTPTTVPTGTGVSIYVLLVSFFQEVNGIKYLLNNGAYNVLHIVEVD